MSIEYPLNKIRTPLGIVAEPTILGLKLALFREEMGRNLERMEEARGMVSFGKISGAVGTYANVDPYVRDRCAQYLTTIAIVGSSLERMAIESATLQRAVSTLVIT